MPEITLPQGTIHYRDTGEGPPVVFLHGLLVDGEVWRKVPPLLRGGGAQHRARPPTRLASHRVNADADLSPAGVARLVGDLLAALDLDDVTLVGNDTGGAISQLVALDHGERVGRLVLTNCDCFDVFPPKEFVPMVKAARVPGALYAAMQPMRAAKARRMPMAYGWLAHEIPDEVTGAWIRPFLDDADIRRDAVAFMRAIDKATMIDAAERLPSVKIPVARRVGPGRSLLLARAGRAPGRGPRRPPRARRGRAHLRERGRARGPRGPHPRLRARERGAAGRLSRGRIERSCAPSVELLSLRLRKSTLARQRAASRRPPTRRATPPGTHPAGCNRPTRRTAPSRAPRRAGPRSTGARRRS